MVDGLIHHVGDVSSLTNQLQSLAKDQVLLRRLRAAGISRRDELSCNQRGGPWLMPTTCASPDMIEIRRVKKLVRRC